MTPHQWLILWLIWFSSRAPQHGRGSASKSEALREADYVEVIEMAEDSSEIVKEQSESVAATNLKSLGDGPAFYQNMGYANAVANQQALQQIQLATVGKIVDLIANTSPSEGGADAATLGMLAKIMGNTPPVTPS